MAQVAEIRDCRVRTAELGGSGLSPGCLSPPQEDCATLPTHHLVNKSVSWQQGHWQETPGKPCSPSCPVHIPGGNCWRQDRLRCRDSKCAPPLSTLMGAGLHPASSPPTLLPLPGDVPAQVPALAPPAAFSQQRPNSATAAG